MDDNVLRTGMESARARARWFLLPAGFWLALGLIDQFAPGGNILHLFEAVGFASPFLILWYFASQGKAWAFFVGAILNALGTIVLIFKGQIIGIGVSGFVTYRLWIAFLDCAALEAAKRAHVEASSKAVFPTSVSALIPLGAQQPIRIADEVDEPSPAPWAPYRPRQEAPPASVAPPKDPS